MKYLSKMEKLHFWGHRGKIFFPGSLQMTPET